MPSAGAGGSADLLPGPGEVATDPAHNLGAKEDVLADEEVRPEQLHAESDDDGPPSDDGMERAAAPAAAPAVGGRGRGRGGGWGGGKGGQARGRGRGGRADAPSAAPPANPPAAAQPSKYQWKDESSHTFTPRAAYDGEEEPQLSEEFGELTPRSRPWQYFKRLDASDKDYQERALNSERYRNWRAGRAQMPHRAPPGAFKACQEWMHRMWDADGRGEGGRNDTATAYACMYVSR